MTTPLLTYRDRHGVRVDLEALVTSRLLIQANSGGGKSHAIRQLLEETHGRIQHIVIDREGEFSTLREKFPYLLVGAGGELAADLRSAPLLARKLLELGVSAIIDLSEMALPMQRQYVAAFFNAMSEAPRALWHDALVVLDEGHLFAPQKFKKGEKYAADSLAAVSLAASIWRKRGFCLAIATQRIAKLDNDVAAELLNKLIGRTSEEDRKRAGDELAMTNEQSRALKSLEPGTFWAYGPAIANEAVLVRTTRDLETKPPKRGAAREAAPPTPAAIRSIADALAELPKEAAEEAHTIEGLRRQLAEKERELRRFPFEKARAVQQTVEKRVADPVAIERAVSAAVKAERARLDSAVVALGRLVRSVRAVAKDITEQGGGLEALAAKYAAATTTLERGERELATVRTGAPARRQVPEEAKQRLAPRPFATSSGGDTMLGKGERVVLTAIAQHDDGVSREQLTVLTGYKRSSRDTYLQKLQQKGYAVVGERILATEEGVAALGSDFQPLPTGDALYQHWTSDGRLQLGERRILEVLHEAYPDEVTRDHLSDVTEYKRSSRDTYIQKLVARRLVVATGRGVKMSEALYG